MTSTKARITDASIRSPEHEAAIASAESEGVRQHAPHPAAAALEQIAALQRRVDRARLRAARHEAALHGEHRDDRLGDAGGAEQVPGGAFRRAARRARAEQAV